MVIYPEERAGFDKVFARIHIANQLNAELGGGGSTFFHKYEIKSMKEKSAILVTPKKISSFIEDLKVLIDLECSGSFKLTQQTDTENGGAKKQFLEISGTSDRIRGVLTSFVEITAIFQKNLYPEKLATKEVEFSLDSQVCYSALGKFAQRLGVLSDEVATIGFYADEGKFALDLKSDNMNTQVVNRRFDGTLVDRANERQEYRATLKKDVFLKFFAPLKMAGNAQMKISDQSLLEMEYNYEKCPYISVVSETASRATEYI